MSNAAAGNERPSPSLHDRLRHLAEATLEYRCLTPAIDGVFNQAVESGAFRAALGTTFTITDASSRDGRIELTVAKPGGRAHTVTLALDRIVGRTPDGRAGEFVFYLQPGADAGSSDTLLELARVLAERIPDTALVPCRSRGEGFGTRAVALLSAALAMVVVIAALLFGFRKLRQPGAGHS
jgi:hypothetical protein